MLKPIIFLLGVCPQGHSGQCQGTFSIITTEREAARIQWAEDGNSVKHATIHRQPP